MDRVAPPRGAAGARSSTGDAGRAGTPRGSARENDEPPGERAPPRKEVFDAWIDARRLTRWWGPHGFTNPVCALDARPGGAIRIHMQGPDGDIHLMTGLFREIAHSGRLVFTGSALDRRGNPLLRP